MSLACFDARSATIGVPSVYSSWYEVAHNPVITAFNWEPNFKAVKDGLSHSTGTAERVARKNEDVSDAARERFFLDAGGTYRHFKQALLDFGPTATRVFMPWLEFERDQGIWIQEYNGVSLGRTLTLDRIPSTIAPHAKATDEGVQTQ